MISNTAFRKLALSFPETDEHPHFDKAAFRVKKKIFVTLSEREQRAFFKLSTIDQSTFCVFDKSIIYPVPNKWGQQGWTIVELKKIKKEMLVDILTRAFCAVAPKKLATAYEDQGKEE